MSDLLTINSAKQGFSWAIDKLLDQAEGGDQEAIGALFSLDTTKIKLDQTQLERFSELEAKRDQAKLSNGLAGNPEPVGDTTNFGTPKMPWNDKEYATASSTSGTSNSTAAEIAKQYGGKTDKEYRQEFNDKVSETKDCLSSTWQYLKEGHLGLAVQSAGDAVLSLAELGTTPKDKAEAETQKASMGGVLKWLVAPIIGGIVLASCNEETDSIYVPSDIYINNTVNLDIKTNDDTTKEVDVSEIVQLLNKLINNQSEQYDELAKLLNKIIDNNNINMQTLLEELIKYEKEQNLQLTQIIDALLEAAKTNNDIYKALLEAAETNNDIYKAIIASVDKIFDKLDNLNVDLNYTLDAIYKAIGDGNTLTAEQNKMIIQMLEILQNIADKQTEQTGIITEINDILGVIVGNLNSMSETQADYYEKILSALTGLSGKLDKLSGDQKELLEAILGQINTAIENIKDGNAANEETNAMLAAILDKLGDLGDKSAIALNEILNAINNNTDIAKGTQELVTEILDKLDTLGDKADDILENLAKITTGTYDLSTIEALLTDLLEATESNNSTLNKIYSIETELQTTVKNMMDQIDDKTSDLYQMLQRIYDKIPEGCNCTETDLTVIIELLKLIVENIGTDSSTNEGIIGQLENLFG